MNTTDSVYLHILAHASCACVHTYPPDRNVQYVMTYKPSLHIIPLHPIAHVQVFGWEQVPPFWQGIVQIAEQQNESGHEKF